MIKRILHMILLFPLLPYVLWKNRKKTVLPEIKILTDSNRCPHCYRRNSVQWLHQSIWMCLYCRGPVLHSDLSSRLEGNWKTCQCGTYYSDPDGNNLCCHCRNTKPTGFFECEKPNCFKVVKRPHVLCSTHYKDQHKICRHCQKSSKNLHNKWCPRCIALACQRCKTHPRMPSSEVCFDCPELVAAIYSCNDCGKAIEVPGQCKNCIKLCGHCRENNHLAGYPYCQTCFDLPKCIACHRPNNSKRDLCSKCYNNIPLEWMGIRHTELENKRLYNIIQAIKCGHWAGGKKLKINQNQKESLLAEYKRRKLTNKDVKKIKKANKKYEERFLKETGKEYC